MDPLEVMFIKVKASMRVAAWPQVAMAVKYDQWLAASQQHSPAVLAAGAPCGRGPGPLGGG